MQYIVLGGRKYIVTRNGSLRVLCSGRVCKEGDKVANGKSRAKRTLIEVYAHTHDAQLAYLSICPPISKGMYHRLHVQASRGNSIQPS